MHASDPVNRIMTEPVLTIAPDDSLAEALRLFTTHPLHHLPVIEDGCVVGMLSSALQKALDRFDLLQGNKDIHLA